MIAGGGEVFFCGHHIREIHPTPFPAFWLFTDVVVDSDNLWGPPKDETTEPELLVEEDDDDDDEEECECEH